VVYQSFPDAVVTTDDGEVVDIATILPSKVSEANQATVSQAAARCPVN